MKKINFIILLLVAIVSIPCLSINNAKADFPKFPMSFYGIAKLDNINLPIGTEILVYNNNILVAKTLVETNGVYGYNDAFKKRLVVGEYSGDLIFKYKINDIDGEHGGLSVVKYSTGFLTGEAVVLDILFKSKNKTPTPPSSSGGSGGGGEVTIPTASVQAPAIATITVTSTDDVIVLGIEYDVNKDIEAIIENTIKKEKEAFRALDKRLTQRLNGRILLQVEEHGEAWYVNPKDAKKYYMANGDRAYQIMRYLSFGITNKDLEKIQADKEFAKKHSGKIFLQVEAHGEAFYVDTEGNSYYLQNGEGAYKIMRNLGLGITNDNLRKIEVGEISGI